METPSYENPSTATPLMMGPFPILGYGHDLSWITSNYGETPSYIPLALIPKVHGPPYRVPTYGNAPQGYITLI